MTTLTIKAVSKVERKKSRWKCQILAFFVYMGKSSAGSEKIKFLTQFVILFSNRLVW
jgi:hypothetical protein